MVFSTSAAFAGLRGPARPSQPAGTIVLIYLGYLIDLAVAIDLRIDLASLLPLPLPLLPRDHLRDRTLMGLLLALTHRRQYFSNLLQRVIGDGRRVLWHCVVLRTQIA